MNLVNALDNRSRQSFVKNTWDTTFVLNTGSSAVDFLNNQSRFDKNRDQHVVMQLKKIYENMIAELSETDVLRLAFYSYDIRGGQGNREHFRIFINVLRENNMLYMLERNLQHIPFYGRWDMLFEIAYIFDGTSISDRAVSIICEQLSTDSKSLTFGNPVSICAKWMPSEKRQPKQTAFLTYRLFGSNSATELRKYRKMISALRTEIGIVEQKMSANEWEDIDFGILPGNALNKYRAAWEKHLPVQFAEFLAFVNKGEKKVNATNLTPVQILIQTKQWYGYRKDDFVEALWKNRAVPKLPMSAVVLADVSGSMHGTVSSKNSTIMIDVCIAMALHLADEKVANPSWANRIITFSTNPTWVNLSKKETFIEKANALKEAYWGGTTNLYKAFTLILSAAKSFNLTQKDMPEALIVITDMEVNSGDRNFMSSYSSKVKQEFENAGYTVPMLIWWNLRGRDAITHATSGEINTLIVSGTSPHTVSYMAGAESPLEMVDKIVNSERYERIK